MIDAFIYVFSGPGFVLVSFFLIFLVLYIFG